MTMLEVSQICFVKNLDSPKSWTVAGEKPAERSLQADDVPSTVAGFESVLKLSRDERDACSNRFLQRSLLAILY